jgi:glycosyltransferase involved in cell wall biosynthesis
MVDRYICLTEFSRSKFVQAGFPEEKLDVKPNFVSPDPTMGSGTGGYAIFVGRLTVEKGVLTLLEAWRRLNEPIPLKIVGEGPLQARVKEAAAEDPSRVQWLGTLPIPEVYKLMGEASFLVFPSQWYETFGRVAIEAFATGTPVIASKIGAIAEIVSDGRTGLHFRPGDPDDLGAVVARAIRTPDLMRNMREAARAEYVAKYTAARNYSMLIDIYRSAMQGRATHS